MIYIITCCVVWVPCRGHVWTNNAFVLTSVWYSVMTCSQMGCPFHKQGMAPNLVEHARYGKIDGSCFAAAHEVAHEVLVQLLV